MKTASLWATGMLALAALAPPAHVYDLWFRKPVIAGTLELPAGPYTVSQDSTGAVFKNQSTGTVYMIRAKVNHTERRNRVMKMQVATRNGQRTLELLELPGHTDVVFGS